MAALSEIGKILRLAWKQAGAHVDDRKANPTAKTIGEVLDAGTSRAIVDKHMAAAGIPRKPPKPAQDKTAPAAPEPPEDFGAQLRREVEEFRRRELLGERPAPPSVVKDSGTGAEADKGPAPKAPRAAASRGPSPAAPAMAVPKGLAKSATVGLGRVTTEGASRGSSARLVNSAGPRRGLGRDTTGNELKQSFEK